MAYLLDSLVLASISLVCLAQAEPHPTNVTVEHFVSTRYMHGVPYDEARLLGRQDGAIATLRTIVQNCEEPVRVANSVIVLGIAGDYGSMDIMTDLLFGRTCTRFRPESLYDARSNVLSALGCMLYSLNHKDPIKSQKQQLIARAQTEIRSLLTSGLSPRFWDEHISWEVSQFKPAERNLLFVMLTVQALGISGDANALNVLNGFKNRLESISSHLATDSSLGRSWSGGDVSSVEIDQVIGVVEEGIRTNLLVSKSGLGALYSGR